MSTENNILQIKENPFYPFDENVSLKDYHLCLKYFPKVYWTHIFSNSIGIFIIASLGAAYYHSIADGLIILVILEILNLVNLAINYNKIMTKEFNKLYQEGKFTNQLPRLFNY